MRKINLVFTTFLVLLFLSSLAKAQTEKLDNLAECAGVVIRNGAVDFYLGDEQSFLMLPQILLIQHIFQKSFLQDINKMICR